MARAVRRDRAARRWPDDPRFSTAAPRKRDEDELDRHHHGVDLARATAGKSPHALQRAGVAAIPTFNNKDLALDEHLRERGYLVDWSIRRSASAPTSVSPGR